MVQDLKLDIEPDIVADAHNLPYDDETFDFIVFDPPYSAQESEYMYGTPPIRLIYCVNESVRVLKTGGYIALYHRVWIPRPKHTKYDKRILVCPGQWHETRTCHVFQKYAGEYK
jgi:tRNA G10  N-methylase Trm11